MSIFAKNKKKNKKREASLQPLRFVHKCSYPDMTTIQGLYPCTLSNNQLSHVTILRLYFTCVYINQVAKRVIGLKGDLVLVLTES